MLKDIRPLSLSARAYSAQPSHRKLTDLAEAVAQVLAGKDPADARALVISSEALVGHIPGRRGLHSYAHAPALLEVMTRAIRAHFRQQVDITIWFTTRAPEPWRKSVYYQNVRTVRVTESYEVFAPRLAQTPGLEEIVRAVRARLAGEARVLSSRLETAQEHALGHMGEVFDLLGVVWPDLTPPTLQNAQCPDLLELFLELNRSALCDAEVSEAKNALLARHRKRQRRLALKARPVFTPEIQGPWALASPSQGHLSDGPYR